MMNPKEIGVDTQVCELGSNAMLVSVHMSNNEDSFIKQKQKLAELISLYPDKFVVVTGDFNAQLVLDDDRMYFHTKDHDPRVLVEKHQKDKLSPLFTENPTPVVDKDGKMKPPFLGYLALANRKMTLGQNPLEKDPPVPTTNKVRVITTQTDKILKPVAAAIDWCFVVDPVGYAGSPTIVSSVVKIGEDPVQFNPAGLVKLPLPPDETGKSPTPPPLTPFAPSSWCSDHFMVESELVLGGKAYRIGSLNVLGESVSTEAFNLFEFVDEIGYRELNDGNPPPKVAINEIKQAFLESFAQKLNTARKQMDAIPESERGQLQAVLTAFSKKLPADRDITWKDLGPAKVFGLIDAKYLNTHKPPYPIKEEPNEVLRKKLEKANNDYAKKQLKFLNSSVERKKGESDESFNARRERDEAELALKKIYVPYLADYLQDNFFQKLYTDDRLKKIFRGWFERLADKQKYSTVLDNYLHRLFNNFDAFALQEVSSGGMTKELLEAYPRGGESGYEVLLSDSGATTTGAVIKKVGSNETPASSETVASVIAAAEPSKASYSDKAKVFVNASWTWVKTHKRTTAFILAACIAVICIIIYFTTGSKPAPTPVQAAKAVAKKFVDELSQFADGVSESFREQFGDL